ncbi:MAG TPA: hypothetical protein VJ962_04305 [Clostridia bacterium]|nr:hypothetical protein [Clostridia bacterium]
MIDNKERLFWFIVLIIAFFLGALQAKLLIDIAEPKDDFIFRCNPHYFGSKWSYPNECPNSYINATGNYCNGVLVCENKLRNAPDLNSRSSDEEIKKIN